MKHHTTNKTDLSVRERLCQNFSGVVDEEEIKIKYRNQKFAKPVSHGGKVKFNLNDNNSLYNIVKEYAHSHGIDSGGNMSTIREYETELLRGGPFNVIIKSSNWMEGTIRGDEFTPLQKYHIIVRPTDADGETLERTPLDALSLTIQPQIPGYSTRSGNTVNYPYPNATMVYVDSTHAESGEQFIERCNHLLRFIFDFTISKDDIVPGSDGIMKSETYHRIDREREDVIKSTLKDSQCLLDDQKALTNKNSVIEFSSVFWHRVGFPKYDHGIRVKLYYSNIANRTEGSLKHLKLETQYVRSDKSEPMPSFDDFSEIQQNLTEVVNSHILWASLSREDLVSDRVHDGENQETCTWKHPSNAREVFKKTAAMIYARVYDEINNKRTDAPRDILLALSRNSYSELCYDDLVDITGLSRSTLRKHIKRLEDKGIVYRLRSSLVLIGCKNQFVRQIVIKALHDSLPEEFSNEIREKPETNQFPRQHSVNSEDEQSSTDTSTNSESPEADVNCNFESAVDVARTDGGAPDWSKK